jgi:hypothetical protein
MNAHIASPLDVFGSHEEVLASLRGQGYRMDVFVGSSSENGQGGDTLASSLLRRLAGLFFDLTLDLYPPPIGGTAEELVPDAPQPSVRAFRAALHHGQASPLLTAPCPPEPPQESPETRVLPRANCHF